MIHAFSQILSSTWSFKFFFSLKWNQHVFFPECLKKTIFKEHNLHSKAELYSIFFCSCSPFTKCNYHCAFLESPSSIWWTKRTTTVQVASNLLLHSERNSKWIVWFYMKPEIRLHQNNRQEKLRNEFFFTFSPATDGDEAMKHKGKRLIVVKYCE